MDFKLTRRQVARGAQPDAETYDKLLVQKSARSLRATYQIRLLLYRALRENKKLVLAVKKDCIFHDDLRYLLKKYAKEIQVVRH